MKFSCEKALLHTAVSTTSRAVAGKSSIAALEGILIEAGSELRLTGYNLETGIRTTVPAEIKESGSLVLSARLFSEIVRKMPDDIVIFTAENYMVNIKCGLSEFNILGTDPEEFPELPTVDQLNGLTLPQTTLKSMISQTLFAVSDNESRPIHTGSLFDVDSNGLTVVSVDGYRLALRQEKIEQIQNNIHALTNIEKILLLSVFFNKKQKNSPTFYWLRKNSNKHLNFCKRQEKTSHLGGLFDLKSNLLEWNFVIDITRWC